MIHLRMKTINIYGHYIHATSCESVTVPSIFLLSDKSDDATQNNNEIINNKEGSAHRNYAKAQ